MDCPKIGSCTQLAKDFPSFTQLDDLTLTCRFNCYLSVKRCVSFRFVKITVQTRYLKKKKIEITDFRKNPNEGRVMGYQTVPFLFQILFNCYYSHYFIPFTLKRKWVWIKPTIRHFWCLVSVISLLWINMAPLKLPSLLSQRNKSATLLC